MKTSSAMMSSRTNPAHPAPSRCAPPPPTRLVLLATVLAALGIGLTSCTPPATPPPPTPKVSVSHPITATVTNWDEYPGHLQAVETVDVRPRVSGYLDSIHFQDGAEVKAGDLLFVIDPRTYQADLDRAAADKHRAETRLDLARNDLKRAETLRGTRAISEEEYDTRSKAVREAEATLAATLAAENAARINLEFTQIKAPISGRIGRRMITVGNLVQLQGNGGAATVLATIVSMDPLYAYFDTDERAFLRYRNHATGNGLGRTNDALACEVGLVNEEGFPYSGVIDFFDNQVAPSTGTIRLRAVLANPDRALIPGLFARVRLPAGPPESALLIPDVAVASDQARKFVYVVGKDNVIEGRTIKTDRRHGLYRAVLDGLTTQDQVVTNGMMMVRPGAKVEITTGTSSAGPAQAAARN